ncbi:heme exporter protein D [Rhizobium wenxiniae]|uniref:Heme exporter protein D n=1 Tax=Rhizobium wenxiniae TaxID=1737357 RepID=A0A7W9Y7G9_9HYPH|nr:hypothetical protein [Rhizobium wenxiniae]MBB6163370.1 heme exporter protein D [Rhizobium wenxiniae]
MIASSLPLFGFDLIAFSARPRLLQDLAVRSERQARIDLNRADDEKPSPEDRHPESFYWGIHLPY